MQASAKMTLQEQFTRTFDVFPFEPAEVPAHAQDFVRRSGSTTGSVYGFGSASVRFQNEVYGCHLTYGKVNKAVIELNPTQPVAVSELADTAPSRMLPDFAANFKPEVGRTFATTVSRDAPPDASGVARYYVQPKDTGGIFAGSDVPEIFPMEAPRGCGPPNQMHKVPQTLLTPAERREALVFDKCHQRARLALRKAANDACQLTRVMQQRHPNGVIGIEGPDCDNSVIYRDQRDTFDGAVAAKAAHAERRFGNLCARRDTQLPYKLLSHDHANSSEERMFPKKARVPGRTVFAGSNAADPATSFEMRPVGGAGHLGFRSNQEKPLRAPNAGRAGSLHTSATGGKPYDIITGVTLSVIPGRGAADGIVDRRAHPSNISLPKRGGTAPTLVGPIPDAHMVSWKPPSPNKNASKQYLR